MAGKRKRDAADSVPAASFQVIAGSYDRVLHGLRVAVDSSQVTCTFTPLFLFAAHAASIRCLAVSPDDAASRRRVLATASPDSKINLYHLHSRTHLGSLSPPSASPTTALVFPSKATLLAADDAGYIHIFRTRDWSLLTSLRCPTPKPKPGCSPSLDSGVNALAVHPSGKLALSVSKNERAVRMWNLMTGRKAGVLAFPRTIPRLITGVSGEGIKVVWRAGKDGGYAVMFERGVVLFGADSEVKSTIIASPLSKVHQLKFLQLELEQDAGVEELCFIATEDGRVIVYPSPQSDSDAEPDSSSTSTPKDDTKAIPIATVLPPTPDKSRIKDFDILPHTSGDKGKYFLTTANSEGIIRVYALDFTKAALNGEALGKRQKIDKDADKDGVAPIATDGFAHMLGEYNTSRRITCLTTAEIDESAASSFREPDEPENDTSDSNGDSDSSSEDNDSEKEGEQEEEEEWGGIE
ncbi:hypothetical protein DRE_01287 [Drechslerella stenobrocha 248]|uniref:Uncharacterized protein n=1 Tax=Drechslerella stenobrocha 248 TaxID=1043628 RepID=W7I599_9PEZI|nr:hypothetical protein DRE_01287 [Drechslerella stenobrocha 248]